jgi:hypothetical protein
MYIMQTTVHPSYSIALFSETQKYYNVLSAVNDLI